MKRKFRIFSVVTLFLSLFLYGCSNSKSITAENEQLKSKYTSLQQENEVLKEKNAELEKQVVELKDSDAKETTTEESKIEKLTIYKANDDTYKKEVYTYIEIPQGKTLKEKMELLSKALSEKRFSNLPIELVKIEKVGGKNIATINFKEEKSTGKSWSTGFFQGSFGGTQTSVTLEESFLQRDYKGEWIDGVVFLYEGKPCDFEHLGADFSKVQYR